MSVPPLKTVAVQPIKRGGGRKQPSPTVPDADDDFVALHPALARVPRRVQPVPHHLFHVGERLRMIGGGYSVARQASACKVVALLPFEGKGALLYRVRSDTEQFERVVAETDLSRS